MAFVWGLVFAPPDYQQGNSFRIFYIHLPSDSGSVGLYDDGCGQFGVYGLAYQTSHCLYPNCRTFWCLHYLARPIDRGGLGQTYLGNLVGMGRPVNLNAGAIFSLYRRCWHVLPPKLRAPTGCDVLYTAPHIAYASWSRHQRRHKNR